MSWVLVGRWFVRLSGSLVGGVVKDGSFLSGRVAAGWRMHRSVQSSEPHFDGGFRLSSTGHCGGFSLAPWLGPIGLGCSFILAAKMGLAVCKARPSALCVTSGEFLPCVRLQQLVIFLTCIASCGQGFCRPIYLLPNHLHPI